MKNIRKIFLSSLIAVFMMIGCITPVVYAKGDGTGGGGGSSIPLFMKESYPSDGEENVSPDVEIICIFTHNVAKEEIAEQNVNHFSLTTEDGKNVDCNVYVADTQIEFDKRRNIYLKPSSSLKPGTKYIVKVSPGVQAKNGMTTDKSFEISFKTKADVNLAKPLENNDKKTEIKTEEKNIKEEKQQKEKHQKEKEQKEKDQKEKEQKEKEQKDKDQKEKEQKEKEQKEKDQKEKEQKEKEQKEKDQKEKEQKEKEQKEKDEKEKDQKEKEQKEKEQKEKEQKEKDQKEKEQKDKDQKEKNQEDNDKKDTEEKSEDKGSFIYILVAVFAATVFIISYRKRKIKR